jgi:hypothetical protein
MNISLLTKWLWKLEKEEGLWQTIVKKIHERQALMCFKKETRRLNFGEASLIVRRSIATTEKWRLEMVILLVFGGTNGVVMNLFSIKYKRLFELSLNKEINVNWALRDNCNSLTFRRRLFGVGANLLEDLKNDCAGYLSHPVPGGGTKRIAYVCQDLFPHIC